MNNNTWEERGNIRELKRELTELTIKVDNLAKNVYKLKKDIKQYNEEVEDE